MNYTNPDPREHRRRMAGRSPALQALEHEVRHGAEKRADDRREEDGEGDPFQAAGLVADRQDRGGAGPVEEGEDGGAESRFHRRAACGEQGGEAGLPREQRAEARRGVGGR